MKITHEPDPARVASITRGEATRTRAWRQRHTACRIGTIEAVDELGIAEGSAVTAIVKASTSFSLSTADTSSGTFGGSSTYEVTDRARTDFQ